jgi:hypothetical protein
VEQSAELRSQQQLLCSIPGVGLWTAARVLAEIEAVRGVVDARQLAAYAGLTPHEQTSGSSVHHPPRLVKTGNSRLRRAQDRPSRSMVVVHLLNLPASHAQVAVRNEDCGRGVAIGYWERKLQPFIQRGRSLGSPLPFAKQAAYLYSELFGIFYAAYFKDSGAVDCAAP